MAGTSSAKTRFALLPGHDGDPGFAASAVMLRDVHRKRVDIGLEHRLQGLLGQAAVGIEGVAHPVQIGLRLLHDRAGNARQDVLESLGGTDAAERARRVRDNADRLAVERALAVGPRGDVDGVLQNARDRAIVFRRDEDDAVRLLDLFAKRQPIGRRRALEVLVEERDAGRRDDLELERSRRELGERMSDLQREAVLAQAAGDRDDIVGHGVSSKSSAGVPGRHLSGPERWMQVHGPVGFGNAGFLNGCPNNQAAKWRPDSSAQICKSAQIVGFHADGIRRYLAPSFSTWPTEGKVKWKPITVAFSAAAMS